MTGLSLVLIAFNLRPVFSSASALLPEIIEDTGLSSFGAGVLTTLPVVCLGVFAPLAPRLAQRIGAERTLLAVLLLLALGTALRGFGSLPLLFLGTAIAGACIATGNVLLPGLVKRDFASRTGLMTGLYTMALCAGAASAAGFTLPLQHMLGGSWSLALGAWALTGNSRCNDLVSACLLPKGPHETCRIQGRRSLARSPRLASHPVHGLAIGIGLLRLWLAVADPARPWTGRGYRGCRRLGFRYGAGFRLSSGAVNRCAMQGPAAHQCHACRAGGIGLLGFLFAPLSTVWLWAVIQGIGQGGLIAVAMTIIVLRSGDAHIASHLSGMAQCVGYMLAAIGPLLVGLIHSLTGSYSATAILFVLLGFGVAIFGWGAGSATHVKARTIQV